MVRDTLAENVVKAYENITKSKPDVQRALACLREAKKFNGNMPFDDLFKSEIDDVIACFETSRDGSPGFVTGIQKMNQLFSDLKNKKRVH
ncbi:MAG: hypothetical protein HGA85_06825 [Nanoarchaeota archaeon]|nr:hypothetical protein [Nanoarchaeota archaeon]